MNRRTFLSLPAVAWPSFRGPNATGIAARSNPPVTWKAGESLWKTRIPGVGHSSPVVWGDRVYVLTAVASGESTVDMKTNDKVVFATDLLPHSWKVLALDRKSGRIVWQSEVHSGTPKQARHVRSSYANATPATDGRRVAVMAFQDRLVCLDSRGKILWSKDVTPPNPKYALDPAASPIFHDGMLINLVDWEREGYLAAYDAETGREIWKTPRAERMTHTTPVGYRIPGGESVIVANSARWVRAYLARTGEELWRFDNSVKDIWDRIPAPAITKDHVIITGGSPDQPIFAIRHSARGDISLKSGERSNTHVAWSTQRGAPYMSTPLAMDGLIYVVATNGVLTVYEERNGERVYQERAVAAGELVAASPVAVEGRVYITAESGTVVAVKAGRIFEILGRGTVDDAVLATPAIAGRLLLIRGLNHLHAVGRA
jgi:outer membrane protein assembly factor BamB